MLQVKEIFYDIQGESTYAGLPCAFIRLSGCNLSCSYCDTDHTSYVCDMDIDRIIRFVGDKKCTLVEITGGEPLLQSELPLLVKSLRTIGHTVLIETNGSLDIAIADPTIYIMDFKCPSSGMSDHNDYKNVQRIRKQDELKFVIGNRYDYEFAKQHTPENSIVHYSPVFDVLHPRVLRQWILDDCLDVRLHLQQHKLIEQFPCMEEPSC